MLEASFCSIFNLSGGAQTDPVWIALCKNPQTPVISFFSKLSASNLSLALCHNPSQTHYWLTCRRVSILTQVPQLCPADNVLGAKCQLSQQRMKYNPCDIAVP